MVKFSLNNSIMNLYKLLFIIVSLFTVLSCQKEVDVTGSDWEPAYQYPKGYMDADFSGDRNEWDWAEYAKYPTHSGQITFHNVDHSHSINCDSFTVIYIRRFEKGRMYTYAQKIELNAETLTKRFKQKLSRAELTFSRGIIKPPDYCQTYPRIVASEGHGDATYSDYYPQDSENNYVQIDYVSKDTIIGSFGGSLYSDRTDAWLAGISFVDKYFTINCRKFIAVRDYEYEKIYKKP
jgi:hypothetical protein